jgi:uncharacterized membrane protein YdfJ with MMPL/SSD domain
MTMTDTIPSLAADDPPRRRGLASRLPHIDPSSPALTWIGLGITALGFVAIAYSWGKVAALLDVSLQMPYVVSGGLTGLALVMVGLSVVHLAARGQDAAERARQVEELQAVLRELRETLERGA